MAGNTTANQLHALQESWQMEMEEILYEELLQLGFYRAVDFPKAKELILPSIGTPEVRSYQEEALFTFDAVDQGETKIVANEAVYCGNSFTQFLQEDYILVDEMIAAVPGLHAQAIKERMITDLLALANKQFAGTGNANTINGVAHRKVATGTSQAVQPQDFAFAKYALQMAKVPTTNLVAIVHPSVAYTLETTTNLVNVSNNPRWEGILETGLDKQMRFVRNVYGFDVFESTMLPSAASETIGGSSTTSKGVANIMFSMANPRLLPFVWANKRNPTLKSWIKEETDDTLNIVTTARWGTGLTRDENLFVLLSDTL